MKITTGKVLNTFVRKVEELSGQNIFACHQCGRCSASCPMRFAMDVPPYHVIIMVQGERKKEVLDTKTIWICTSCSSCTIRCPKGLDLSKVMEALRQIILRQNVDLVKLSKISPDLPQIAVVSNLRKFTG